MMFCAQIWLSDLPIQGNSPAVLSETFSPTILAAHLLNSGAAVPEATVGKGDKLIDLAVKRPEPY
jgi:hypothetical protein